MKLITLICAMTMMTVGFVAQAQDAAAPSDTDCEDEANKDNDECLLLPPVEQATDFIFGLAPLLGSAAAIGLVAAVAGGGGSTTGTPLQQ
jgi:hypothetical protein